jgi:type II secretory pathway component PulL
MDEGNLSPEAALRQTASLDEAGAWRLLFAANGKTAVAL